jgi:hypothetical protein
MPNIYIKLMVIYIYRKVILPYHYPTYKDLEEVILGAKIYSTNQNKEEKDVRKKRREEKQIRNNNNNNNTFLRIIPYL